jgi:hypothetical protein
MKFLKFKSIVSDVLIKVINFILFDGINDQYILYYVKKTE